MKAHKLINKGCQGYLCCIFNVQTTNIVLDDIPAVKYFPDVLLEELPRQLIDREIEFVIDVIPGTQPISKTPYCMSTTEMEELKVHL